jgi:hypothetical protein
MDLLCYDSSVAFPILMDYMNSKHEATGVDIDEMVELYMHVLPRPQFHHSFFITKPALMTWDKTKSGRKVVDYMGWLFKNQKTFGSQGVNLTES